jgi:hypothetical protein
VLDSDGFDLELVVPECQKGIEGEFVLGTVHRAENTDDPQ